ncbi:hypothetical protein [Massilia arenae]|uniref:Uncharacterized protein n=1 Tax=Massilia arenae TaxID=2603288 RepID=A0A5C7G351_9BURK|nr:hypothetical protein [Massilia arenae]TXF99206.1 hypothetical protein FVD38_13520 [Massilia arenae]
MERSEFDDIAFFYYTVQSVYHFDQIPISSLEELDIDLLQRVSKAAHFDGVKLTLAVDTYDKNLIVGTFSPDRRSKHLLPFSESPDSEIYVSNSADVCEVMDKLQEMSERYSSLNPPPFQKYSDDDGPEGDIHKVTVEEFLRGNRQSKHKHELFMRDHGMHQTVIPSGYKKPAKFKLIK